MRKFIGCFIKLKCAFALLKLILVRACRFVQVAACDVSRDMLSPGHLTRLIHWQCESVIHESLRIFNLVITRHYFFYNFLRCVENYLFLNDFNRCITKLLVRLSYHLLCRPNLLRPLIIILLLHILVACLLRFCGSWRDCKLFIKLEDIIYPVINHLFIGYCILLAVLQDGDLSRRLVRMLLRAVERHRVGRFLQRCARIGVMAFDKVEVVVVFAIAVVQVEHDVVIEVRCDGGATFFLPV